MPVETPVYAQAETYVIIITPVYAQAQTHIIVITPVYAQADASIKQVYYTVGQTNTSILAETLIYAQAEAYIVVFGQGQAQAYIFNDILLAQAQAYILPLTGIAQAQAWISLKWQDSIYNAQELILREIVHLGPQDLTNFTANTDIADPVDIHANYSGWIKLTLNVSINSIQFDTINSNYDTMLALYSGTPGSLVYIASDDDSGGNATSLFVVSSLNSGTYYLEVSAWSNNNTLTYLTISSSELPLGYKFAQSQAEITRLPQNDTPAYGLAGVYIFNDGQYYYTWITTRDNPVAYYKLDTLDTQPHNNSGTITDSLGAYNLQLYNSQSPYASKVAGMVGYGTVLSYSSGYSSSVPINFSQGWALEYWIKPGTTQLNNYILIYTSKAQIYLGLGEPNANSVSDRTKPPWAWYNPSTGTKALVSIWSTPVGRGWWAGSSSLDSNTWYHVVANYSDDKTTLSIWINGQLAESQTIADTLQSGGTPNASYFQNGYFHTTSYDDYVIYNHSLDNIQIINHYNLGVGLPPLYVVYATAQAMIVYPVEGGGIRWVWGSQSRTWVKTEAVQKYAQSQAFIRKQRGQGQARAKITLGPLDTYSNRIVQDGATSYWPMDSISAGIQDIIGTQNLVESNPAAVVSTGINPPQLTALNTQLYYNYFLPENALTLFTSSEWTFEGWFKFPFVGRRVPFFSIWKSGTVQHLQIGQGGATAGSSGTFINAYHYYNNANHITTDSITRTANTWYYIALTQSGGTFTLYIDGVQSVQWAAPQVNSWTGLYIAYDSNYGYSNDPLTVDGLAYYNFLLTPTQIAGHNIAGRPQGFAQALALIYHPIGLAQAGFYLFNPAPGAINMWQVHGNALARMIGFNVRRYGLAQAKIIIRDIQKYAQAQAGINPPHDATPNMGLFLNQNNSTYSVISTGGWPNFPSPTMPNNAEWWASGIFVADVTGTWQFQIIADYRSVLTIDTTTLIDVYYNGGTATANIAFTQGDSHKIYLYWYGDGSINGLQVWYKRPGDFYWNWLTSGNPPWTPYYLNLRGPAQARADVFNTSVNFTTPYAQAMATIMTFGHAIVQTTIKQVYQGYSQALSQVGGFKYAQALAYIVSKDAYYVEVMTENPVAFWRFNEKELSGPNLVRFPLDGATTTITSSWGGGPGIVNDGDYFSPTSTGANANNWMRITWSSPQIVSHIQYWERNNGSGWDADWWGRGSGGAAGTPFNITFSDGSTYTVPVGENGYAATVAYFARKTITWFQINAPAGQNSYGPGFAEIEAYGTVEYPRILNQGSIPVSAIVLSNFGTPATAPTLLNTVHMSTSDSAMEFFGSQALSIGNNTSTITPYRLSTGSVEVWFKTSNSSGTRGIVVKQFAYGIFNESGRIAFYDWSGSGWHYGPYINDGKVHHAVLTWTMGVGATLYLDRNTVATGALNPSAPGNTFYTDWGNAGEYYDSITIGDGGTTSGQYFIGVIDDVSVYNFELTPQQVTDHYRAGGYGSWETWGQAQAYISPSFNQPRFALVQAYINHFAWSNAQARMYAFNVPQTGQAQTIIQPLNGLLRFTFINGWYTSTINGTLSSITIESGPNQPSYNGDAGRIPSSYVQWDSWGMAWSGTFIADETGTWSFQTYSDDGSDLWIGNTLVVNNNYGGGQGGTTRSGTIALTAGQVYTIHVRWGQGSGPWAIYAYYKRPSDASYWYLTDNKPPWIPVSLMQWYSQANASIERSDRVFSQAQAQIGHLKPAQAQATIFATASVFGQALALMSSIPQFGQAEAYIYYIVNAFAQAETYVGHFQLAQALAKVSPGYGAGWGQSKATIITTYQKYAQSKAWIIPPTAVGNALTIVKRTERIYSQANTWIIPPTAIGFAQARIIGFDIPRFGLANGTVKTYQDKYGLANAWVIPPTAVGNAQARLIGFDIPRHAQAKAWLRAFNIRGFGQAQTYIITSTYGLATVWVKQTYPLDSLDNNYATAAQGASATASQTFLGSPSGVLDINDANYWAAWTADFSGPIEAWVQIDLGQTRDISGVLIKAALTSSYVKVQYYTGTWVTIADNILLDSAQSFAFRSFALTSARYWRILAIDGSLYNGFLVVGINTFQLGTSSIKSPTFSQAMAFIGRMFGGQAQAYISPGRGVAYGQTKGNIVTTDQHFAQTNTWIIPPTEIGFAQADILTTYIIYGLSKAWIIPPTVIGHAAADIFATTNHPAQAKASIQVYDIAKVAQAKATIVKGTGFANAMALNRHFGYTNIGRARAVIGPPSRQFGQAEASIIIVAPPPVHAQAQADIVHYGIRKYAQAGALIDDKKRVGFAMASIVQVYRGYALAGALHAMGFGLSQAQADIEQTYSVFSNSKAWIHAISTDFTTPYAQSGAVIRVRHWPHGQARAFVTIVTPRYAQATTQIGYFKYAQANARIIAFDIPRTGVAAAYILVDIHVTPTEPSSDRQSYLVRFGNYTLPGYAQSESYDSVMNIGGE